MIYIGMAKNDTGATKADIHKLRKYVDSRFISLEEEIVDHFEKTAERIINEFSNKIDPVLKQYSKTEDANEILN
jgi:hypothetical protein